MSEAKKYPAPATNPETAAFWDAAKEEGRSRVYGGIHFTFDVTAGHEIGRQVGTYIFGHFLLPVSQSDQSDSPGGSAGQITQVLSREGNGNPSLAFANGFGPVSSSLYFRSE